MDAVGGRLLGKGQYGCTFEPAPRCADGRVFKTITFADGKVMRAVGKITDEPATSEFQLGQELMKIPLYSNYFAPAVAKCPVRDSHVTDVDWHQCSKIDKKSPDLTLLIMPNGGEPLGKWAESDPHRFSDNFEAILTHLLEGMVLFHRAGIVHNDIHSNNILIDSARVPRFIDFGIAFKPESPATIPHELRTGFKASYILHAPEIKAWQMVRSNIRLQIGIQELKRMHTEFSRFETLFPKRQRLDEVLPDLVASVPEYRSGDKVEFLRRFGKKFDSWRLGLTFWWMWREVVLTWPGIQQSPVWARRTVLREVLGGLTDVDPRTRWSAEKALKALKPESKLLLSV